MNRHASRLLAMARRWLGVDARDRTLDAELESFLQHEMDARIDEGMTPGEARRTALASIGGIQQVKERARDARTGAWLDALWRDTRHTPCGPSAGRPVSPRRLSSPSQLGLPPLQGCLAS
jgi:hypothetical protein